MGSRFISAVAFYGPKTGALRELVTGVQALIEEHVGADFRPYSLEQVHATLIALNGVRDPETGAIVNEYLLAHAGVRREMDLPRVMDILTRFAPAAGPDRRLPAGPGDPLHQPGAEFGRDEPSPCKAGRSCWWDGRPTRSPESAVRSTSCGAR